MVVLTAVWGEGDHYVSCDSVYIHPCEDAMFYFSVSIESHHTWFLTSILAHLRELPVSVQGTSSFFFTDTWIFTIHVSDSHNSAHTLLPGDSEGCE